MKHKMINMFKTQENLSKNTELSHPNDSDIGSTGVKKEISNKSLHNLGQETNNTPTFLGKSIKRHNTPENTQQNNHSHHNDMSQRRW